MGACRYGCGTNCAAPVTVFWLFGVVSVIYGLLGGRPENPVSAGTPSVWDLRCGYRRRMDDADHPGVEADRCHGMWSPRDHHVAADEAEADPFDEIKKVH